MIAFAIALVVVIVAGAFAIAGLAACAMSSNISREEEKHGQTSGDN